MSLAAMEIPFPALSRCSGKSPSLPEAPPSEDSTFEGRGSPKECEEEVSSAAVLPHLSDGLHCITTSQSNRTAGCAPPPELSPRSLVKGRAVRRRNSRMARPSATRASSSPSPAAASAAAQTQRGVRFALRRRSLSGVHGQRSGHDVEALALPLGMSIAAVFTQVLEQKTAAGERTPADHLSTICTAAVKESVASVFGRRFDGFMRNFETSFSTTLKTLQLVNQPSPNEERDSICSSDAIDSHLEGPPVPDTPREQPDDIEEICENAPSNSVGQHLILHGNINQRLARASQGDSGFGHDKSFLTTFERSVIEQARSNDLKTYELALAMQRLQLKESQLTLSSDANSLERCKLSMGMSKASFKEEKLKTQLEDTRHAELLKKCIDCLVAGLLIMSASLIYAAYVYSYERIAEATDSCTSPPKESKTWWIPNPMSSVTSGLHTLKCHATVLNRMLFGVLMILVMAYSVLQRSVASRQTMPVTIILLLLGVACGFFGKLCVDTLGGSGYCWLLHWEVLCLLHFFANVCTPSLFRILHGPVTVSQEAQKEVCFRYWIRRVVFYSTMLLVLPVSCGLRPFASLIEWKDHFSSIVADQLFEPVFGDRN